MHDNPKFSNYAPTYFLTRQAMFIGVAFVAALVTLQVPIAVWEKWAPWLFAASLALLILGAGALHRQRRERRAALAAHGRHELPAQ